MNKSRLLIACLLLVPLTSQAQFGQDAMFGLVWGSTPAEIAKGGIQLTKVSSQGTIEMYKATVLPKNLSDVDFYQLIFANNRLVKIAANGKTIENDPLGTDGKQRYSLLKASLSEKYGAPTDSTEITGVKLFNDPDEFYQCLKYSGCGMWASIFKTSDRTLVIDIKGLSRGSGYVSIRAESVPEFAQAVDSLRANEANADKDAL